MKESMLFACCLLLLGFIGGLGYIDISWRFAWLGLFLTVAVVLLLIAGRRHVNEGLPHRRTNSRSVRSREW